MIHTASKSRHARRLLATAITAVATVALVAGCSPGGGSSSEGEVSYWVTPNASSELMKSFLKDTESAFAEAYPGSTMKGEVVPWESALTKMTAAFSSNNPPDVSYMIAPWMNQFREAGVLADLRDIPGYEAYLEGIPQSYLDAATTEDGELIGLPYLGGMFTLTYNVDVWEKAGEPELPTTYEDMIDFAKAMTLDTSGRSLDDPGFDADDVAVYGMAWPQGYALQTNYVWNYLKSYGADMVTPDGTSIGFDNPEGRAALEVMKAMLDSGAATPANWATEDQDWMQAVKAGTVGMSWTEGLTEADLKAYPDTNIRVIDAPAGPAGQFLVAGIGFISVAKNSDHLKSAKNLAAFLVSPPTIDTYTRLTLTKPVHAVPEGEQYYTDLSDPRLNDYQNQSAEQVEHAYLQVNLNYDPQEYLVGKFNDYLIGAQSLDDMIAEAKAYVEQLAAQAG